MGRKGTWAGSPGGAQVFQLWQETIGEDSGMVGIGTNVSFRTDVQSHRRVRFLDGAAAADAPGEGLEAWGMGGGPENFSEVPTSDVSGGMRVLGADGCCMRGGTGGGVFFGAIAA